MNSSFTLRLTLRFVVLVTLTTAVLLAVGGWILSHEARSSLEKLHEIEGVELAALLGPGPLAEAEVGRKIAYDADSDAALFFIQVRDGDGHVVFRSSNLGGLFLPALSGQAQNWVAELPNSGRVLISDYREGAWQIQVASRLEPSEHMLRSYAKVSGLLLGGAALLSVLLGYQFSRATLKPVRAIESTARRIRADNLSERIPAAAGHGELTALIELLNDTFNRLQRSFEHVNRFTADASHELKTPLSLVRLNAEKLQRRVEGDAESESLVAELLDEIARLNRIIESLLFLAKTENGSLPLLKREVEMSVFIADFATDAAVLAEDAGVTFVLGRNERGRVLGESGLLRQLLLNVVGNALSVSPRDSVVRLESYHEAGAWWWVVVDEGPGLPEIQLERVFARFARYESGASAGKDGAVERRTGNGLGLAICRGIAEIHGGSIFAENRTDRSGLRVIFKFPPGLT